MQVESKRSGIFGSSNWTRGNQDRERKGKRGVGMTDTKIYQGCSEVFGVSELLSLIDRRLYIYSQTFAQYSEEGSKVGLNKEARGSI